MKKLVQIKKVTINRVQKGTDKISFEIEAPTPYPELQSASPNENYNAHATVECRRGYAEEWLKLIGITDFELIQL